HGTNPQYLVEKIIRTRIYESRYWKEECFALNAELIVDKGIELRYIGGIYGGNIKPTPFLCLLLKMLQIQPTKDIIIEFIRQEDYKYIRALGAFYLRLTGTSLEAWKYLEPLYNDYRKLRHMDRMGKFSVMHMDEFIDILLREDRVFDVILPRISKRHVHEEAGILEPRVSVLEEDINNVESDEEETNAVATDRDAEKNRENKRNYSPKQTQRSRSPRRSHSRSRSRSRSPHHKKSSRSKSDKRRRERSLSRERRRRSRSRSRMNE
ncbi:pre-mRNA-splicing factor 38A-like protein, partial [Dinothrombium tinctorium]